MTYRYHTLGSKVTINKVISNHSNKNTIRPRETYLFLKRVKGTKVGFSFWLRHNCIMDQTQMCSKGTGLHKSTSTQMAFKLRLFSAMKSNMLRQSSSIFIRFTAILATEFILFVSIWISRSYKTHKMTTFYSMHFVSTAKVNYKRTHTKKPNFLQCFLFGRISLLTHEHRQ